MFYLLFDRIVFGLFFVMNLILWSKGSSGAVPFSTLIALLALWFGVSVPLTFVGAYFGFRKRVSLTKLLTFADNLQLKSFYAIRYFAFLNYIKNQQHLITVRSIRVPNICDFLFKLSFTYLPIVEILV